MIRAAVYARVSSSIQRDRHTIESQLRILPEYVKQQGWILAGTYVDDGKSAKAGQLEKRDGFARLQRDAEAKAFDVLVVVDVDRITRTDDMMERAQILGPLQRNGIDIVTPSGGRLDMRSFLGEFWVTIQALVAAEENRKRRERCVAGKQTAIARGKKPSGPTPFGHVYDKETGTWSLHPERAPIVREIFERVVAGEACSSIADDLTSRGIARPRSPIWQRERVWQIAVNPSARGEWIADKRRKLVIPIPPIVDAATWYAAQDALMAHGKRGLARNRHTYLLQGKLGACGMCSGWIGIASAIKNGPASFRAPARYVCVHRRRPRYGESPCELAVRRVAEVDERLWTRLRETIVKPTLLDRAVKAWKARQSAAPKDFQASMEADQVRLGKLASTEQALLARFRRGSISESAMDHELDAINREKADIERRLRSRWQEQSAARSAKERGESIEALISRLRRHADASTTERRRELVELLFRPGDVVLGHHSIHATMRIGFRVASALASDSRSVAPELLKIRLVA
jgi:site-specific DNA recombinase